VGNAVDVTGHVRDMRRLRDGIFGHLDPDDIAVLDAARHGGRGRFLIKNGTIRFQPDQPNQEGVVQEQQAMNQYRGA
jgi:hypothetical protein